MGNYTRWWWHCNHRGRDGNVCHNRMENGGGFGMVQRESGRQVVVSEPTYVTFSPMARGKEVLLGVVCTDGFSALPPSKDHAINLLGGVTTLIMSWLGFALTLLSLPHSNKRSLIHSWWGFCFLFPFVHCMCPGVLGLVVLYY